MQNLECTITTPEKLVHQSAARLVVVPATDGELGILARHAPLTALIGVGELRIEAEDGTTARFFVDGGFVQVIHNSVNVLATDAERSDAIDRQAASVALDNLRAEKPQGLSAERRAEHMRRLHAAEARARVATGTAD